MPRYRISTLRTTKSSVRRLIGGKPEQPGAALQVDWRAS